MSENETTPQEELKAKHTGPSLKFILISIGALIALFIALFLVFSIYALVKNSSAEKIDFDKTVGAPQETLKISIPNANIEIVGADTNEVKFELNGKEHIVNNLKVNEGKKELSLETKTFGISTFRPFGFIDLSENQITGKITIPENLDLELNFSGQNKTTVKNINSKSKIAVSGSGEVTFEDSTTSETEINISGAANIKLDQCITKLKINISGSGSFEANNCTLTNLEIKSSGFGNIVIKEGNVINAKIDLSGAGTIKIPEIRGKLDQEISGSGKVEFN